jgi:hypothetical protein
VKKFESSRGSGARVIDLSGGMHEPKTVAWFPKLDALLAREFKKDAAAYAIPSAATAAATLRLH